MQRVIIVCIALLVSLVSKSQTFCGSVTYEQDVLSKDAGVRERINAIHSFIAQHSQIKPRTGGASGQVDGDIQVLRIPVVVHVLYSEAFHNISYEQIRSQIEVLNKCFRRQNAMGTLPGMFANLAADVRIEFQLANIDPVGNPTTGIVRKRTTIEFFSIDDRIKSSARGGSDAWDPSQYLNIWVGNTTGGVIGYASFPGGAPETDGIVVRHSAFGTTGTVTAPYNLGKTTVHEVGHWLGLRHIWGDADCGNDHVEDTPPQQGPSRGCPSGLPVSCSNNGNMYMNYMDLTSDACTSMFTLGQASRMRSLFFAGGPRHTLLTSKGCDGTPVEETSVEETIVTGLSVYPNPATNLVSLELSDAPAGERIEIYSLSGHLMATGTVAGQLTSMDIRTLPRGTYIIRVGAMQKKLLKQ
jgi:hypothetical protein